MSFKISFIQSKDLEDAKTCQKIFVGDLQKNNIIIYNMKIVEGFRLRDVMGQATVIGEGVEQINFNKLITLNSTAAYLWREIEGKEFDASTLSELLIKEYGIDESLANKDSEAILAKWIEIGVVK